VYRLMSGNRKGIPQSVRMTVAARQRYDCKLCKRRFGACIHIDHILRVSDGGSNHIDNLQALCPSCHEEKTQLERIESLTSYTTKTVVVSPPVQTIRRRNVEEKKDDPDGFIVRPLVDGTCKWCLKAVSKYFDHSCPKHPAKGALVTLEHVTSTMSHIDIQDEEVLSSDEEDAIRKQAHISSAFSSWHHSS